MRFYKDQDGGLHCIDSAEFEHLLPEGCVAISDSEAATLQNPPPTDAVQIAKFEAALDAHLDAVAQSDRWSNRITYATRAGYPNKWQAEAKAFGTWMDACNAQAYQLLDDVIAGRKPMPASVEAFIATLPSFAKP